ncbi:MAG TPA: hypothetical protein VLE43_12365 [Candidatus Saccharimonadia bacterium]|nr:hypothetical protein [Candidatus Saccharimonadia bacterium]
MFRNTPLLLALNCVLLLTTGSAQAQESSPAPTPESFLKIINEQIATMANTTFEISYSATSSAAPAPAVAQSGGGGELVFDANGNVVGTLAQPGAAAPPPPAGRIGPSMPPFRPMPPVKLRVRVQFASLAEYYVGHASSEGKLVTEYFGHPDRGHAQAFHLSKEYVTDIKAPRAYTAAFGLLPQFFVEYYKYVASTRAPGDLKWTLESLSPSEATIALRDPTGLRMQATFALPSNMCTSLKTYATNDVELEHIQPAPESAAGNWPFLAASYTSTSRGGTFKKTCDIVSVTPLQPGMMKQHQQPAGFTRMTSEERTKRIQKQTEKMRSNPRGSPFNF